eukprot:5708685-Ditylum_brightwellii.AAC.1
MIPPTSSSGSTKTVVARRNIQDRPHDITIFGCTGNAGRSVALHTIKSAVLAASSNAKQPKRRICVAGRNRSKVEATLNSILKELDLPSNPTSVSVSILPADIDDPSSLSEMTKSTHILFNCVGPFARYGERVIQACIESSTHYADITGEVPWIEDMITKYDAKAKEANVALLPFAGYDCVPSELGIYLAVKALKNVLAEDQKGVDLDNVVKDVTLVFANDGANSGLPKGTAQTVLDGVNKSFEKKEEADSQPIKKIPFNSPEYESIMSSALSTKHFLLPSWSEAQNEYTAPNFMSPINIPVLYRAGPSIGVNSKVLISDRSRISSSQYSILSGYGFIPIQAAILSF